MASTAVRLGKNAKMYRNTGSYASPTWDEIDNVKDLAMNLDMQEADASIRGFGGWTATEPTQRNCSIDFAMNYDTDDTDWEALRAAFFALSALEFLILDRATGTGAQGLRATFKMFKFANPQPLAGLQTTEITMKPCIAANAPAWYVGA